MSDLRDDSMDAMLRRAHGGPAPELSPDFGRRLEKRLRPRRLSPAGRRVLTLYGAAALAVSLWAMSDLPLVVTAVVLALSAAIPALVATRIQRRT